MNTYTPKELRKRFANKKWVMSYNKLLGILDPHTKEIMYIEDYGPNPGFFIEGWRALHFPRTSPIVLKSYREGNTSIYILRQGKANLHLIPSFAPIGIEECRVTKDKKVHITFAGFGGGGVSASFSRGMAEGVEKINIIQEGGGNLLGKATVVLPVKRLLLIGIDDTDKDTVGATYSLVHNIATDVAKKYNLWYAIHVNVQLFPYNPHKTKNCMSTVVGIIFESEIQKKQIINDFKKLLKKHSVSENTGMAVFEGFHLSPEFLEFSQGLKFHMLEDMNTLRMICKNSSVELHEITGERGLIGAVAALGFFDQPDFAAKLPSICR